MILFYFTYILAILLALVCPDVIISNGSPSTDPITILYVCQVYFGLGAIYWFHKHRHLPIIGAIYNVFLAFIAIAAANYTAKYIKKEAKEWWNED